MLVLALFTVTSWAVPSSKKPKFKGFYIGLDGGVDSWNLQTTVDFFDTNVTTALPAAREDSNIGRLGGSGGLFTGWAFTEGQTYGSLELNLDLLSNQHNQKIIMSSLVTSAEFLINEKQEYGASLDFHGGYIFGNAALLYITAGYAIEHFKSSAKYSFFDGSTTTVSAYSTTTNMQALRIGLGGEYAFARNWRFRIEGFGKVYSNKPFFLSNIADVQVATNNNTIGAKRSYLAYYVGLIRQF